MKRTLLFLMSLCLLSCAEDDSTPAQVRYFEISIGELPYVTTESVDWILLHDKDGTFIDMKPFESGQTIMFDSMAGVEIGQIVMTFLMSSSTEAGDNFMLSSYYYTQPGEKWEYTNPSNSFQGTTLGDLNVTVEDSNLGADVVLSQQIDVGQSAPVRAGNKITFQTEVYAAFQDIMLFATDKAGTPYYKLMEDVKPGVLSFSLKDFSPFDGMIEVHFPETTRSKFLLLGYEDGMDFIPGFNGYKVNAFFEGMNDGLLRSSYNAGYVSRFSKYYSALTAYYGSAHVIHETFGAIPKAVVLPDDFNTTITDPSFDNFSLSDNNYDWRRSEWSIYEPNVNGKYLSATWTIYAPSGDIAPLEFPDRVVEKFPVFNYEVKHTYTLLYRDGKTLNELLQETFKGATKKENYVQISKWVQ